MDNKDILRGKLHDWINKAEKYSMPVFSKFLNQTEISFIKEIILEDRLITEKDKIGDLFIISFSVDKMKTMLLASSSCRISFRWMILKIV